MENGRIVLEGPSEKLRENEDVKEFYLGLSQVGERKSYRDVKHYKRRKRWLG
jgi:branched-chain amino acid transport system ATP-binding protein